MIDEKRAIRETGSIGEIWEREVGEKRKTVHVMLRPPS